MTADLEEFTHDPVELRPVPADTLAQWPPGTFLENLAPAPGGGWLVSIPSHHRVDRVGAVGAHVPFAEVEHCPTGIVADGDGALVLSGTIGASNWQLVRVGPGGGHSVCDLPELRFGNGMQRAADRLLANDSARGLVLSINPATGPRSIALTNQQAKLGGYSRLPPSRALAGRRGRWSSARHCRNGAYVGVLPDPVWLLHATSQCGR